MRLTVQRLGRIKNTTIDVRPFTVFIGANNTNKTWTAYSLYGLACKLSRSHAPLSDLNLTVDACLASRIEQLVSELLESFISITEGEPSTSADEPKASQIGAEILRDEVVSGLSGSLHFSFDSKALGNLLAVPEKDMRGATAALELTEAEFNRNPYSKVEMHYLAENNRFVSRFISKDESDQFASFIRRPRSTNQPREDLRRHLTEAIHQLVLGTFAYVAAFPAERKALVTAYLTSLGRIGDRRVEREMPYPIRDFSSMLAQAEFRSERGRVKESFFSALAMLLETEILKGTLEFRGADEQKEGESPRTVSRGVLNYALDDGMILKMHATASLVRSLAGLDVYLKHFCNEGDLVVIDEPEMNAHPDAQLMIMELLAILANKGVTVVITTHSPYIVDHLNNLIEASQLPADAQESISASFKLKRKDAFLEPEAVSTYHFTEAGNVIDIFNRAESLIDLSSFSEASNYVTNLYGKILEKRHDSTANIVRDYGDGI